MQFGLLLESAYCEIKKTMLGRRVLRARTLPGITQEIYALLTVYQALRIAITDTTLTAPGTDPDRASFTIALQAARDQVIQAAGVIAAKPSTWPAPSAAASWTTCCPPAACASAPAPSNGPCPATPTRACTWTAAPTRPPSASTS
jgi:hypothetical protein